MRELISKVFKPIYTLSLIGFIAMAFLLVYTQVIGLIFGLPHLIEGAEAKLEHAAILFAVAVGIFGFVVYNAEGTKKED